MRFETLRCHIYQLSKDQFRQFIYHPQTLWNQLGVIGQARHDCWFQDAMQQAFNKLENLGCEAWWLANWPIVKISKNQVIGGMLFKGPPNQDGQVEIGYGLSEAFHNKGYMSECIQALTGWALKQDRVSSVIAETEEDNVASEAVLLKNGFEHLRDSMGFRYWKKVVEIRHAKLKKWSPP